MNRLHRLAILSFVVVASIWTARAASAQEQARPKPSASGSVSDSVTLADVQKAADQLALAVQEAVRKATEDPAVKVAALKVAKNAVTAAQIVVTQQADVLQTMLDALAREIAIAADKQQARPRNH
jgi:NADH:ubiquinone oxidoreductase subunit H